MVSLPRWFDDLVLRPLRLEVEHQDVDGNMHLTAFDHGVARLVSHEIDHLEGRLYRSRMRPGTEPIRVSQYKGTGESWVYRPGGAQRQPS